jgi:hypothetical protein
MRVLDRFLGHLLAVLALLLRDLSCGGPERGVPDKSCRVRDTYDCIGKESHEPRRVPLATFWFSWSSASFSVLSTIWLSCFQQFSPIAVHPQRSCSLLHGLVENAQHIQRLLRSLPEITSLLIRALAEKTVMKGSCL